MWYRAGCACPDWTKSHVQNGEKSEVQEKAKGKESEKREVSPRRNKEVLGKAFSIASRKKWRDRWVVHVTIDRKHYSVCQQRQLWHWTLPAVEKRKNSKERMLPWKLMVEKNWATRQYPRWWRRKQTERKKDLQRDWEGKCHIQNGRQFNFFFSDHHEVFYMTFAMGFIVH